ncbi:MAG: thiamine pyrophosphate-dependent enzyme [Bacteroidota bacterium]
MNLNHKQLKKAILIRTVEQEFLNLFSKGKLNGTVHTCVGQEFSALAFAGQLKKSDFVFSNHRCHGHYISFTDDWRGLIAELLGKKSGTCGGIGSSQHLCKDNFFSNGIQGGIVPVAAGYALANKLDKNDAVGVVYIGDGTLGEGVLYETMNIISKWDIPLIIVCENNFYAQSTSIETTIAGDILARAESFGIRTSKSSTWDVEELFESSRQTIDYVRKNKKPAFHLVETYRLNPHSKGDDDRKKDEIDSFILKDPINIFENTDPAYFSRYYNEIHEKVQAYINSIENDEELKIDEYYFPEEEKLYSWSGLKFNPNKRQVELLNEYLTNEMESNRRVVFIGEDVLSPYGGAFKVAKGLSEKFPEKVFSTPISEAAIIGISNGLALNNYRPLAEIMFGDFILLGLDQIINHAAKFAHMYNFKVKCPLIVRTPMGGGRGYGPTHSQSLEKHLIGISNTVVAATNQYIAPSIIYKSVFKQECPVIVIENKVDYGKKNAPLAIESYKYEVTDQDFPVLRIKPQFSNPDLTIITYGGMSDLAVGSISEIFKDLDQIVQVLILTCISPIDFKVLADELKTSKFVFTLEEGSLPAGIGSEIVAGLSEILPNKRYKRIAALPVPIPSVKSLESGVLPTKKDLVSQIKKYIK